MVRTGPSEKARGKRPRSSDARNSDADDDSFPLLVRERWPRPPKTKFTLPDSWTNKRGKDLVKLPAYQDHLQEDRWTQFDSFHYNGMCDMVMEPTRILSQQTLGNLGLKKPMMALIASLGLGTMATKFYPLYPELARQFIASCRVRYTGYGSPSADKGELVFKVNGSCYSLTFHEICECFGFDCFKSDVRLPEAFPDAQVIWSVIAKDVFKASNNAHKDIRHPVLRMFVKMLGSTLLCVMENNKMRLTHLSLLSYAIGDRWPEDYGFAAGNTRNLGALFAYHLEELKEKAWSPFGKTESVGSLLTPLLLKAGVVLPTDPTAIVTTESYLDEDHLKRGQHIKPTGTMRRGKREWCYEFYSSSGRPLFVKLPTPYASIATLEDLSFQPPAEDLYTPQARPRRSSHRGSSSQAAAADDDDEGEDLPPFEPLGPYPRASEAVLADPVEYRRHQESVLERMWNFLRCTRTRDVAPSVHRAVPDSPLPSASSEES